MNRNRESAKLTRRQLLVGLGAASAWLATGAGQRLTTSTSSPSATFPAQAEPADLIFTKGKVITIDSQDSIAQAVAVKNGLIQVVGTDAQVKPLIGPSTQVVDLRGRALTPGLIDAHNHLQIMGLMNSYFTPFLAPDVKSIPDLQKKLAEQLAKKPEGEWLQGYYWGLSEGRLPNRQDLDPASPRHPVWIMQQGGHYGSCNSLALKIAGITRNTPNPEGGVIERDAKGEPTGVFYNHRAMDMLRKNIPQYTTDMVRENIASVQPLFAACGVTTFHDNNVRGGTAEVINTYLEFGKQGKMLLRGSVYYTLEWPQDLDRALKEMEKYEDPYMRFAGYKFLIDGQIQMAYCHKPHKGIRWDMPTWEPTSFKKAVRALHDTGLQICVHCIGDAAADLVLDAYEEAMNANPRPDPRHRIEHAIVTTPDATRRMKDLGVVVCTQPHFLRAAGDYWATVLTEDQLRRVIVTREWLEGGVHLALGSDAPTVPWYAPTATLVGSLIRQTAGGRTYDQNQALTIQEALRAHTMGSAYAGHEEDKKGSIEVGKLADLVVWDQDPYKMTPRQLFETTTVAMTVIGGKVAYQKA